MFINKSPWLHQLNRKGPSPFQENDHEVDVAIIGVQDKHCLIDTSIIDKKGTPHV